jgi:hypothetical protein
MDDVMAALQSADCFRAQQTVSIGDDADHHRWFLLS